MAPRHAGVPAGIRLLDQGVFAALKERGYAELPVDAGLLQSRITPIIAGMQRITSDSALRALFPFHPHTTDAYGNEYQQEAGLKHETRKGENKYVFQYIRGARWALGRMGAAEMDAPHETVRSFLEALDALEDLARTTALSLARTVDQRFGRNAPYTGSLYLRVLRGTIVLRVLRYLEVAALANDAIPHIDRGLLTLHIYATHEGLIVVLPNGEQVRVRECELDSITAFWGRKYMAASRGKTRGVPHGVKYKRVGGEDRYCIVAFIHPETIEADASWLRANDQAVKAEEGRILL
jgi:hypothetical protein